MVNLDNQTILSIGAVTVIALTLLIGGSAPAVAQTSEDPDPAVVDISHDQAISPGDSFEVVIRTTNSVGTVALIESEGFDVNTSSSEGFAESNRIEFIDTSAGNSTYTATVDVIDGEAGDTGNIVVWVGAERRANAVDEQVSPFEITGPGSNYDSSDGGIENSGDERSNSDDSENDDSSGDSSSQTGETTEPNDSMSKEESSDPTESASDQENESGSANGTGDSSGMTTEQNSSEREPPTSTDDSTPGFSFVLIFAALVVTAQVFAWRE